MKYLVAIFTFCISMSHGVLANSSLEQESKTSEVLRPRHPSVLTVSSYLPLINDAYSSVLAQSQLTVTPTQDYTVREITIIQRSSTDGSCTGDIANHHIDNGAGNTVTLVQGHAYTSTDLSNYSVLLSDGFFTTAEDNEFQLLDNNLDPIGASVCIAAGGECTSSSNCGWTTPQAWTP